MKKFCLAFLFVLLLPVLAQAAPLLGDLSRNDLTQLIKAHSGKVIMLNFYATWCPPCRQEIPELERIHKAYASKGVVILGLSVDEADTRKQLPAFLDKLGVTYPSYTAKRDLISAFGISSIPFNVFYDKSGKVVLAGSGMVGYKDLSEIFDKLLED